MCEREREIEGGRGREREKERERERENLKDSRDNRSYLLSVYYVPGTVNFMCSISL